MSEANALLARLRDDPLIAGNALAAFRSNPQNFAAVRDVYFAAAGISPNVQISRDNVELVDAVTTAVRIWIGKNQGEIAKLNPALVGRLISPPTATVEPLPEGPSVFDLLPTAGDVGEGIANVLGDIRKTAMWVIVIVAALVFLPRFLPPPSRKRAG